MGKKNGNLNIPAPEELILKDHPNLGKFPYVFVADEAFQLHDNIMRPYPGQADRLPLNESSFNYRLSTARKMSECAFGTLARRFQIYNRLIELLPENVTKAVLATVAPHNMCHFASTPRI